MQGTGWNFLVGTEKPSPWPCSNQPCAESPDKGRIKRMSHLLQVIFNLLFSPENSTNSKLQVPPCITTPQKGFSGTGAAALVLWGAHSAHRSFERRRKKKKNNLNCTVITTKNHLSIMPQMIIPTSSQLLTYSDYFQHRTRHIVYSSSMLLLLPCPPLCVATIQFCASMLVTLLMWTNDS